MKLHNVLVVVLFLMVAISSNAQKKGYVNAMIYKSDGDSISAHVKMPISNDKKKLIYRIEGEKKKLKLKYDEIDYLKLESDSKSLFMVRTKYHSIYKGKLTKHKSWIIPRMACEGQTTFVACNSVSLRNKVEFVENYLEGMGGYMVQRPGEEYPTVVGMVFTYKPITQKMFDKQRKKAMLRYYKNDKEIHDSLEADKRITQEEMIEFFKSNCE